MAKRKKKPKQRAKWSRATELMLQRLGARRRTANEQAKGMDALAVEPVPIGSGLTEFGEGKHCYVKANRLDGSIRVLRFRTREAMQRAMALGVAADQMRDGDSEELAS